MTAVEFAIYDADGRYTERGIVSADSPVLFGPNVYLGAVDLHTQYHSENGPTNIPAKPAGDHDFDWATKTWIPNLERGKARLRVQIEHERDARIFAPIIEYDNKLLDADEVSIDRLGKKLAALDSYEKVGLEMPTPMLVWRDADNVTHAFATHAEYKAWLAGFAVALDLRGTQAFAWSWLKKSELDAITTVEELVAFDPTT
jgi:hypothetical protein